MRKKSDFLPFFIAGGFFFLAVGWWFWGGGPVSPQGKEKIYFPIAKGEKVVEISLRLKEQGLVKNSFHFQLTVFFSGLAKKIQAGGYYLAPSMAENEIAKTLTKGTNDKWMTVVEGWRQEEIGQLLIKQGFAINPKEWVEEIESQKLEGKLFPDSYLFPQGATQAAILNIFSKNFQKRVLNGLEKELAGSEYSLEEILIFASLVEREAQKEDDRAVVAGILLKRRKNGWPLQVDATVQYALASQKCSIVTFPCDWWPAKLSSQDLKINSAYNTYLDKDLPLGPICNPGLSSIKAVLHPKDSPYWYYLSGKDGQIHYARTISEHQANIRRYLK